MKKIRYTIKEQQDIFATQCVNVVKNHNRTERESEGVGPDIFILKKLFLELCGPHGNSFGSVSYTHLTLPTNREV